MGDRANVVLKQKPAEIFLYTHWGGSELPEVVRGALAKRWRWNDDSYLARIIFCELVKGSEAEETGFGIATAPPDNSYPYLVVDCAKQEVRFEEEQTRKVIKKYTFAAYVALDSAEWPE
jgi:hypothetical protein